MSPALSQLREQYETSQKRAQSGAPPAPDLLARLHAALALEHRAVELEAMYTSGGEWTSAAQQLGFEAVAALRATAAWLRTVQP